MTKKFVIAFLFGTFILLGLIFIIMRKGQAMPKFIFPQPSGKYAVGTKLFELTDLTRNDPETSKPRELVAQVWYPSDSKPGKETAPYAYEAREWYKKAFAQQGVAAEKLQLLDGIRTHAITDAPVCKQNAPYPVVIFAHGYSAPLGSYSFFCEEIASHGYVVAMVMHTYITSMIRFSDGREITATRNAGVCTVIEECFADIEFMLNQAMAGAFGPLSSVCDFKNIGMVGHSLGGIMTAQTCRRDARIKAGINLDAPLWGINATKPFHKPFLFIRTSNFYADMSGVLELQKDLLQAVGVTRDNFNDSIEQFCRENGKDTMQIVVEGANHMTFMDNPIVHGFFAKIFATSGDINTTKANTIMEAPEILHIIRKCVITFLNKHLKGQESVYPPQVLHDTDKEDFDFYIPDHHPKHRRIEIDYTLLDAYVGQYRLGEMILTIKQNGNVLWVQVANQPAYPIYPESETKFFYTVADRQVSFVKDKNGKTIQLILHQVGTDQMAEKIN